MLKNKLNINPMTGMGTFAQLSKISYSASPHVELKNTFNDSGLTIDDKHSGVDILTITDSLNDVLYIVFRGTDITNMTGNRLRDIIDDLGVLVNDPKFVHRLAPLTELAISAIKSHPHYAHIIFTGHSLGGFVGAEIMNILKTSKTFPNKRIEGVFFNMGSSPYNKKRHNDKDIIHYTTNNPKKGIVDPISLASILYDGYRHIMVPPLEKNTHSLNNFIY